MPRRVILTARACALRDSNCRGSRIVTSGYLVILLFSLFCFGILYNSVLHSHDVFDMKQAKMCGMGRVKSGNLDVAGHVLCRGKDNKKVPDFLSGIII